MNKLIGFLFISITTIPLILRYVIEKKFRKKLKLSSEEDNNFYHQLLSITMKNFNCRQHLIEKSECNECCSFAYQKILQSFISSAKSSICLCMYMLTLKHINYELIKAHKRGVSVRIIADQVMLQTKPVKENFSKLTENGITYKVPASQSGMMHHKFCLIDKDVPEFAKMFSGSLNLTSQGLCSNFDNTILTNNINIIKRFGDEFEELWNLF